MDTGEQLSPNLHHEPDRLRAAMYAGRLPWAARERIRDLKLRAAFATIRGDTDATTALQRLIYGLPPTAATLLSIDPALPLLGPQPGNTGLDALLHLARYHHAWNDDPEAWSPAPNTDAATQIGALARHLFAYYPLPTFLDTAWLLGFADHAETYRDWFVHLARGGKLEAIRFPLPLTHRAAHHFLQAPADFSIPAALRFGQVRALGGSDALAQALAQTFLTDVQPDETFYLSLVTFLVNHPRLPLSQVGPLADYVRFRKFGTSGTDAPEPSFSMKGRTVEALTRLVADWHESLARLGAKSHQSWPASGVASPLDRIETDPLSSATCHWRIVEITNTLSLLEEGRTMRHCVRSYQDACLKGDRSIWSLRLNLSDSPGLRTLLTIEINNRRHALVQVRGKCNQTMSQMRGNRRMMLARTVLRDWAQHHHLGITCSL